MARNEENAWTRRSPGGPRRPLKSSACAAALGLLAACAPSGSAQGPADVRPAPIYRFEGDVQLRNGAAFHYLAILVRDPGAPGGYLGTIDIPKQALAGAALEAVAFEPGAGVEFALNAAGHPRWSGAYDTDGTLVCEFRQSDVRLPCSMREVKDVRPGRAEPPQREQTPLPPFPYTSEEARYVNPTLHVQLSGTLTLPAGAGPHPALIVIGDRGMQDRDCSFAGHRPWLVLADYLARAGIAVLRVDPRGAGGGVPSTRGFDGVALESDVESGLALLRNRPEVDAHRLGLLAHGYAGSVAIGLSNRPGVAFIVLLAPPALPGRELLARQHELAVLDAGASPLEAASVREDVGAAIAIIESDSDPAHVRERLTTFSESLIARNRPKPPSLTLNQMLSLAEAPGFRELARHDPVPLLRALRDPVLVLVPGLDREVDPADNLPVLRAALAQNPDARIETLPRLNHGFQSAEAVTPTDPERLSETFAPAALERIATWIRQVSSR